MWSPGTCWEPFYGNRSFLLDVWFDRRCFFIQSEYFSKKTKYLFTFICPFLGIFEPQNDPLWVSRLKFSQGTGASDSTVVGRNFKHIDSAHWNECLTMFRDLHSKGNPSLVKIKNSGVTNQSAFNTLKHWFHSETKNLEYFDRSIHLNRVITKDISWGSNRISWIFYV